MASPSYPICIVALYCFFVSLSGELMQQRRRMTRAVRDHARLHLAYCFCIIQLPDHELTPDCCVGAAEHKPNCPSLELWASLFVRGKAQQHTGMAWARQIDIQESVISSLRSAVAANISSIWLFTDFDFSKEQVFHGMRPPTASKKHMKTIKITHEPRAVKNVNDKRFFTYAAALRARGYDIPELEAILPNGTDVFAKPLPSSFTSCKPSAVILSDLSFVFFNRDPAPLLLQQNPSSGDGETLFLTSLPATSRLLARVNVESQQCFKQTFTNSETRILYAPSTIAGTVTIIHQFLAEFIRVMATKLPDTELVRCRDAAVASIVERWKHERTDVTISTGMPFHTDFGTRLIADAEAYLFFR